jgi:hypothetical protein
LGDVLGPVGDDHEISVVPEVTLQGAGRVAPAESGALQFGRNHVEIGNDMLLDPVDQLLAGLERQIQFFAVVRDEREAQQFSADTVIFRVEKIAHLAML